MAWGLQRALRSWWSSWWHRGALAASCLGLQTCVTCLPARFNEFGRACWELQKPRLADEGCPHFDWRFISLSCTNDETTAGVEWKRQYMKGLFLTARSSETIRNSCLPGASTRTALPPQEHWDECFEAGAKTRPTTQTVEPLPTLKILAVADGLPKPLGLTQHWQLHD